MTEDKFQTELMQYINTEAITKPEYLEGLGKFGIAENNADYVVKLKLWTYKSEIKTTEQLWSNFKEILERNNQNTIDNPLSIVEFNQVKKAISNIKIDEV